MAFQTSSTARLGLALTMSTALAILLSRTDALAQAAPTAASDDRVTGKPMTDTEEATASGPTRLRRLVITGSNPKDETFKTPAAVTVMDAVDIERFGQRSAADVLRTAPGVFTQSDAHSPALAVNIRGMQDFGRNAITIDGARQNLQVSGHGANGWVFVDPALLADVEIQRGTVSSVQGSGIIGGAVNFRTLDVDDVVAPDRQWGAMTKTTIGDNGYGTSVMGAAGYRFNENVGIVGALSGRKSHNYTNGWGELEGGTGQDLKSGLFKIELAPGEDQTLDLGAVAYRNDWVAGSADVAADVKTFTAAYSYTPAGNELIDLKINAYVNDANFDQLFSPTSISGSTHVEYNDLGVGLNVANTSTFDLRWGTLAVEFGGEYYFDDVEATTSSTDPDRLPDDAYKGLTPSGKRGVGGIFSKSTLSVGMVDLIGALRYDHYTLTGSGYNPHEGGLIPVGPFEVDKSKGELTGKATIAIKPVDELQFYGSYGTGFRPPAVSETLMAGIHPGGMSFLKFRPNPFLEPETSKGWEVGANLSYDGLVFAGDRLRVKASYYDNTVENYITSAWSMVGGLNYTYINMEEPSRLRGFEVEASYDTGLAFIGIGYTDTDIDLTPPAPAFGITLTPPEKVWTATGGMRLFEEKLTIGGRVRFVSEAERFSVGGTTEYMPAYRLYDVFANYRISDSVNAFVTVENITNEGYYIAKDQSRTGGPGRTVMAGFSTRF